MFNSPLAWCPIVHAYVALDEPNHACAAEHRCATGDCPLKGLFAAAATIIEDNNRAAPTGTPEPTQKP